MTTVGAYVRISDDRDGESTATARQLEDCRAYAKAQGWKIGEVFEDADFSASKRKVVRPAFERLIEAVSAKRIDGVLAWRQDRLQRSLRDFVRLADACEDAGGFVLTLDGVDTRNLGGQILGSVLTVVAAAEAKNTSGRVARWHRERVAKGKPGVGGNRRFGYTRQSDIIEAEATLIREAMGKVFAGESIRGIALDWKRRGVVTPLGNPWHPVALRAMLIGAQLSAQREHEGVLTAGTWEPIITPADTIRLRAILTDPARRSAPHAARSYLLTGFVRCGRCGERLIGQRNGPHRSYACVKRVDRANCGSLSRMAAPVDELVTQMVFEALRGVDLRQYVEAQSSDELEQVAEMVRADQSALKELSADFYVHRVIDRSEFFAARDSLTARLGVNHARLQTSSAGSMLASIDAGESLERRWEGEPLEWRRSMIATVIDSITINPPAVQGRREFDPSAIVVKWKF